MGFICGGSCAEIAKIWKRPRLDSNHTHLAAREHPLPRANLRSYMIFTQSTRDE